RGEETAHHVDERGLAGTVRSDEGQHLAFLDGEVDVIDGVHLAERLHQVFRLEQAHARDLRNRPSTRAVVPTMPSGSASTSTTSRGRSSICQYTVTPTAYFWR